MSPKKHLEEKTEKTFSAEEKRIKSINERKKSYQKQKHTIKTALANVDSKLNSPTKIVFKDDASEDGHDDDFEAAETLGSIEETQNTRDNLVTKTLFEENDGEGDDDIEYNFEVKEHLQGKQGRKLMELQSKFKNDKRFVMDERFLDNDIKEETEESIRENKVLGYVYDTPHIEITKEEKQKELSILEDVLGKKLVKRKISEPTNTERITMRRFDPTNANHLKHTLKEEQALKETKKKKKKKVEEPELEEDDQKGKESKNSETVEEIQNTKRPTVSKETFYTVTENLKETFKQNEPFSFISMFDSHKEQDETNDDDVKQDIVDNKKLTNGHLIENTQKNPFQYDSSDSDTEERNDFENESEELAEDKETNNSQNVSLGATQLWREPFFFRDDDYRFQEGTDFVRKFKEDDNTEFEQVRRNIKKIIRAKVRNNQRKSKPFRKKLGGKRIVKIKKAMKNR